MKRKFFVLGTFAFLLAFNAAANTTPSIAAASPLSLNAGDPPTTATIATVSDAEDSAGSLTVTATSVPSGISISSISNNNGSISAIITAACDAASSNNITLEVTDSGGATASATYEVHVRPIVPPAIPTISAATNGTGTNDQACPEQPLTLTASSSNATSYQWYVDGDPISGATSVTYVATGRGSYTATASNACYTSAQSFFPYNVSNPTPHKPFVSSNGSTSLCSGGSVTLSSDSATGIQWYRDGVAIAGAGSQSYTATTAGSYTCILNALGCHSSESDAIVVTVSPAPSAPTITAGTNGTGTSDQACPEQPLTLVMHDSNSSLTDHQWYVNNDTIDGASSNQLVVTSSGDYRVVATLNGCSTSSAVYTVQNPTPHKANLSAFGPTQFCTADASSVTLWSDSATGIQWYRDGVAIAGGTNESYVATVSGSYTVILNALGCHSSESDPIVVTINSSPSTPAISATQNGTGTSDQACPEQPLLLTATDSNPSSTSYQWFNNNDTIQGATSKTYSATAVGDYTIVATSVDGCSVRSAAYSVHNPTPHAPFLSARSATTFCTGGSVILDSDSATGIQWYKDGVAIAGAGHQSYTATTSGSYNAQLNALGCHSQFGTPITVTVVDYPSTPTISATQNGTGTSDQACPEQPLTLTASSSGATSFQWYRDDELLSGETNATLTVTASSSYSATATNGTCTTPRSSGYVVQNPTPHSAFLSARSSTTFCAGGSVILDSNSATGIQWYKDGVAISGAGSQSYTATTSGTYTAILNALGCHSGTSNSIVVSVVDYPSTPAISATQNGTGTSDQACPEQPLTLTASSSGATSYQWYRDDELLSGETNATLTVTAASSYSATATNGTCTTPRSAGYVVQNPTPHSAFLSARSATTFCAGGSVILDSNSATGIQWYKDGVAISGAGSQSYTATTSGTYTAILNALGCHSGTSNSIVVSVVDYPSTPAISATQNGTGTSDQACPEQPLTLTASSSGATSYQWYRDDELLSGETNATLTVTAASSYSATATNGTCTTPRSSGYVVQNPTPHRATLSAAGSTTFCSGGSVTIFSDSATGIQWYKDGVAISGANSSSYTATTSGSYSVILNALGCHSSESDPIVVTVNGYPSATITAPSVVYSSSTGNSASVASAGSGATYNWSISGGTITSGSGTNAITFTAGSAGTLTLSVTVTNGNGCAASQSANVSVVDHVTVTNVTPSTGSSSGGTSVTIKGTGFLSGATVTFGGSAATSVVVVSSTKITATTPAHAQGSVDVVVTNSNTASGTLTGGFTYKKK